MMKIAVLFEGDIYHVRGEFMAIHNRMKYLVKAPDLSITIYVIQRYYDNFTNWIKGNKQIELKRDFYLDGIHYNCLYYKRSYIDYFCRSISKYQTTIEAHRVKHFGKLFFGFDLLFSHSLLTGLLALDLKQKKGIPYVMMWHGSSIHTLPFENTTTFSLTRKVLRSANHNFFVSNELFNIAKSIAGDDIIGSVSFNGVDTQKYWKYPDSKKISIAKEFHVDINKYNIAFIGNYLPVKNVKLLPKLFARIFQDNKNVQFHIVGNGPFKDDFHDVDIPVRYWGNMSVDNMPDIYNCMNLIVLPSLNEGLPMTCLESLACGTAFVGSRVGGIADVVGEENTVPHTISFETDFADLCKKKISQYHSRDVTLSKKYDIKNIVDFELSVFKNLLSS